MRFTAEIVNGKCPTCTELTMLVEHLAGVLEEVDKEVKSMRNNAVNIEFLKDRTKKLTEDVEKLIRNGSGH